MLGGGFNYFCIFTPTCGNDPIWREKNQVGWNGMILEKKLRSLEKKSRSLEKIFTAPGKEI